MHVFSQSRFDEFGGDENFEIKIKNLIKCKQSLNFDNY